VKRWIIGIIGHWLILQQRFAIAAYRWAGAMQPEDVEKGEVFKATIPDDPQITPLVVMAAWRAGAFSERTQAELNGCMNSLRECDQILDASQRMFAELSGTYGPKEAFVRMAANHVLLGMNLGRRISA
jgi:hypothetical protein